MPESVTDRPTKSHEYIFLLTKRPTYFYDAAAIAEQTEPQVVKVPDGWDTGSGAHGTIHRNGREKGASNGVITTTRNKRSVWTVATQPYPEAHFATFPEKLIEPCILAGTSERGQCPACGAPWRRVVERDRIPDTKTGKNYMMGAGHFRTSPGGPAHREGRELTLISEVRTTGWQPSCTCDAGNPIPQTVLDIFAGSGTTGVVSLRHGRSFVGIDLSPAYVELARKRITQDAPLFNRVEVA